MAARVTGVAVLIPVLDRPQRVAPLVASLRASAVATPCRAVFVCSPEDWHELNAVQHEIDALDHVPPDLRDVRLLVTEHGPGPGDYARKINLGIARTDEPFMLFGADDLQFRPGWAERAIAAHVETGACVIGTNDLGNSKVMRGEHATHPLVCRSYVECGTIDEPDSGKLLHEGYGHQHVDNEFVETALHRETWAFAADSIVEHLHPFWHKGEPDATYSKGQASAKADAALFQERKRLWGAP